MDDEARKRFERLEEKLKRMERERRTKESDKKSQLKKKFKDVKLGFIGAAKTIKEDTIRKIESGVAFRVNGEAEMLLGSLIVLFVFLLFISTVTLFIFPVLVLISAINLKARQGHLLGKSLKVSEHQLTNVYNAAKIAAERLSMPIPDVFVTQNPVINAFAIGLFGRKSVVLNSKTIEVMNQNELVSILGHEFSHIKCNHTKWMVITSSTDSVRIPILSSIFGFVLLSWSRKAEYTADRGAIIASKDLSSYVSALVKITVGEKLFEEVNMTKLLAQMKDADWMDKLAEILGTHPYTIKRILNLTEFSKSEQYAMFTEMGKV